VGGRRLAVVLHQVGQYHLEVLVVGGESPVLHVGDDLGPLRLGLRELGDPGRSLVTLPADLLDHGLAWSVRQGRRRLRPEGTHAGQLEQAERRDRDHRDFTHFTDS
jgi:hypothetical protein